MPGPLGCAQEYRAAVHWRGGADVHGLLDNIAEVEWGRTANDVSDAKVKIAPESLDPDCWQMIGGRLNAKGEFEGGLEPWIHELSIYRDDELLWQGPVIRVVMSPKQGVTVEAMDVVSWLDRTVNTWRMTFKDKPDPDAQRVKGPVTRIAETILKLNLGDSTLSKPKDWASILPYIVRHDPKKEIRFERDGSTNRAIWAEYVGTILRELTKRGLLFTTVGRALVLQGKPDSETPAISRLGLEHFIGDVEVIKDGTNAATASFATSQDQQNPSKGRTEIVGKTGTPYGRLDVLTKVSDANAEELRDAAEDALKGRYPAPITISIPQGAQLSPDAPLSVHELVPGQRIDVVSAGWCMPIGQGFMLSDVQGSWSQGGEKIALSLVPLSDAYGKPTPPPDDGSSPIPGGGTGGSGNGTPPTAPAPPSGGGV